MLSKIKENKIWFFSALISFAGLFLIVSMFPYSGDDWAWGSSIGLDRLSTFFEGYNGRYAGNLLVMVLTRNVIFRNFFMAGIFFLIFCFFKKCVNNGNNFIFFIAMFLFFAIPKGIFRQAVVWTSGFSNYVIPVLVILVLIYYSDKIMNDRDFKKIPVSLLMFFVSFVGGLFMENFTLGNIAVSVLVIGYFIIIKKKVFLIHIAYATGTIVSAVVMFSNSSYGIIASGNDGYRSVPDSPIQMILTAIDNIEVIYSEMYIKNVVLNIFICLMMFLLLCVFLKKQNKINIKSIFAVISFIFIFVFTAFSVLHSANSSWCLFADSTRLSGLFDYSVAFLHSISMIVLPVICIEGKNNKIKTVFPLIVAYILTVPLIIVTPIGSRNFFQMYMFFALAGVYIFDYLFSEKISNELKEKLCLNKFIGIILSLSVIFGYSYYFVIYSTVHGYVTRRLEYIDEQIEDGKDTITVGSVPFSDYVWTINPKDDSEIWSYRLKLFYGYDTDLTFEYISYSDFDKLTK